MTKEYAVGIDIGSTSAKTVAMRDGEIVCAIVQPTGWSSVDTAQQIRSRLKDSGIEMDNAACVATGYGRVSVPYADKAITEITCHAKGAAWIYGEDDLIVIDIGGQDTKVIRVQSGQANDFLMNDKCSAGTGRFLEIMGGSLGLDPGSLCELARTGSGTAKISSLCTVFAESEIVSLVGRGEARENIAYAIVDSITEKVAAQVGRFAADDAALCITGGLCECGYLVQQLGAKLKRPILSGPQARFAGAIGAAVSAGKYL